MLADPVSVEKYMSIFAESLGREAEVREVWTPNQLGPPAEEQIVHAK